MNQPTEVVDYTLTGSYQLHCDQDVQNNIVFNAGSPTVEMLKVSPTEFWVRGIKVDQDDKEAETVYNAFKSWMMWAKLNER
jgi:hypothetical protein